VIVARFVDDETSNPKRFLAAFQMFSSSMNNEQQASVIAEVCFKKPLNLDFNQLIGAMSDRCVNMAAINKLSIIADNLTAVPCMSHVLAGNTLRHPHLDRFISLWTSLFSRSLRARTIRSKFVDGLITVKLPGETR